MRLIDLSFDEPAMNLALDELLLDNVERGTSGDTLRFWESPITFVVLGTAQTLREETHEAHCEADGVPILRRCSAGGCVLQGTGCINYSLALSIAQCPEIASLHESYRFILGRLVGAFRERGISLSIEGTSDLALDGRKVSGNAQRRRRQAILHHGTLLYRPNFDGMCRYLREPRVRPDYRGVREHPAFVTAIPMHAAALRETVRAAFRVTGEAAALSAAELEDCRQLVREKYGTNEWNHRR